MSTSPSLAPVDEEVRAHQLRIDPNWRFHDSATVHLSVYQRHPSPTTIRESLGR
jgi:hypothetical protein